MKVSTFPGVFAPISDSFLLEEAVAAERPATGARLLDVCTGSGLVALAAASLGVSTTAVDISRRAVWTARWNAWRATQSVRVLRGSLFEPVKSERFDYIVSNPPYVPSTDRDLPRRGRSRAWAAGPDGRVVLDRIIDLAPAHLFPGGRLLVVHSSLIGEDRTLARLADAGFEQPEVVERRRGPLGPLMREQQRRGTIAPHIEVEDLLVVRAIRSRNG